MLKSGMIKKVMWLMAGFMVGAGLSSTFADSREPASVHFKVLAVSEEDANEKASEMLREGAIKSEFKTDTLIAASVPACKETGSDFSCEMKLTYQQ